MKRLLWPQGPARALWGVGGLSLALVLASAPEHSLAEGVQASLRVVGGEQSTPGSAPFVASLQSRNLVLASGTRTASAIPLVRSPNRPFQGTIVDCGLGVSDCPQAKGAVCLIERGQITFAQKVQQCERAGGIAAVIYNHSAGLFQGELNEASSIPALGVSRSTGQWLQNQQGQLVSYAYDGGVSDFTFCGGSYIGGGWVVTAAHCVNDIVPESMVANIGSDDVSAHLPQANLMGVEAIYIHGGYRSEISLEHDIALLKLSESPKGIEPLPLASVEELNQAVSVRALARALGRGVQQVVPAHGQSVGQPVKPLYEVDLPLIDNASCQQAIATYGGQITPGMLCAGVFSGGQGTCFGDSGGPLTIVANGREVLAGLTSWGIGCALPELYDVYTRVPAYLDDINALIDGSVDYFGDPNSPVINTQTLSFDQPTVAPAPSSSGDSGGGRLGWGFLAALGVLVLRRWRRQG